MTSYLDVPLHVVTCYTWYMLHMLQVTLCTGAAGVSALPHRGLRLEAGHGDGVGHHGPGGAAVQHAAEGGARINHVSAKNV